MIESLGIKTNDTKNETPSRVIFNSSSIYNQMEHIFEDKKLELQLSTDLKFHQKSLTGSYEKKDFSVSEICVQKKKKKKALRTSRQKIKEKIHNILEKERKKIGMKPESKKKIKLISNIYQLVLSPEKKENPE